MGQPVSRQYQLLKQIEVAFDDVVTTIQRACAIFKDAQTDVWALHEEAPDHKWLLNALLDFWYQDGQDGRETRPYIGMIAAPPTLWKALSEVNEAKDTFHRLMMDIKAMDETIYAPLKGSLLHRHPQVKTNLDGVGLARLNLKQAWRHIPMIDKPVKRVNFTWYVSGRSIRRISVAQAERQLMKLGADSPHVKLQLGLLGNLAPGEPLAQVQRLSPTMRANVYYDIEVLGDTAPVEYRRSLNLALPLIVPADDGKLPHYRAPASRPPEKRTQSKRLDQKIEDIPFLKSIRVHRYIAS
ncbi:MULTISPECIES: DNA replication terminus site-binding protein [Halomonadaceae]|uniref:DNA replication terminus site-binding protein n=1 Tax=Halomonas campaniensis TaxID=213554 RepID=A0A3D0KK48_9GAMM|nr:DNA replication terminus site-binding protein [Halomonas sp. 3F2F]HCA03735.1 DNA replication terminus site-binding protein [Halomonas campaniensis]